MNLLQLGAIPSMHCVRYKLSIVILNANGFRYAVGSNLLVYTFVDLVNHSNQTLESL